jgi:hypothetical protein
MGNDVLDVTYGYVRADWTPNREFIDLDFSQLDGTRRSLIPARHSLRVADYVEVAYWRWVRREHPFSVGPPGAQFNLAANDNLPRDQYLELNRTQLVAMFDPGQLQAQRPGYEKVLGFFTFVSQLRARGVPALVTLAPNEPAAVESLRLELSKTFSLDLGRLDYTLPSRVLLRIRDRVDPGIAVLDLTPFFRCASHEGQTLYYLTNTHWNPEGNALAARVVANHLKRFGFLNRTATEVCAAQEIAGSVRASDETLDAFVRSLAVEELTAAEAAAPSPAVKRLSCGSLDGVVMDGRGELFVWGWTCDPSSKEPVAQLVLQIDGIEVSFELHLGLERPDVEAATGLTRTGWNARIATAALVPGEHRIEAVALATDGSRIAIPAGDRGRVTVP